MLAAGRAFATRIHLAPLGSRWRRRRSEIVLSGHEQCSGGDARSSRNQHSRLAARTARVPPTAAARALFHAKRVQHGVLPRCCFWDESERVPEISITPAPDEKRA